MYEVSNNQNMLVFGEKRIDLEKMGKKMKTLPKMIVKDQKFKLKVLPTTLKIVSLFIPELRCAAAIANSKVGKELSNEYKGFLDECEKWCDGQITSKDFAGKANNFIQTFVDNPQFQQKAKEIGLKYMNSQSNSTYDKGDVKIER